MSAAVFQSPSVATAPAAGYATNVPKNIAAPITYSAASTFNTTRVGSAATSQMRAAPVTLGTSTFATQATMLASPAMTVAGPKTIQTPTAATRVAAPVTVQAPVTSTVFSQTRAPVTNLPASSFAFTPTPAPMTNYQYSSPVSYQTLPTVSSAIVAPAQAKSSGTGAGMRVTILPTKEGAAEPLTTFLNSKGVADAFDGLAGLNFAQAFFEDDKMVIAAQFDSLANMEELTAVNQEIMGKAKDHISGAPARYGGEVAWFFKGPGKINGPVATQVIVLPLKPDSEAAIMGLMPDIEQKCKGEAFDEFIDITFMFSEDNLVSLIRCSSIDGLQKGAVVAGPMLLVMMPYAVPKPGAIPSFTGTTAWSYPPAIGAKKTKAKKAKKGCC